MGGKKEVEEYSENGQIGIGKGKGMETEEVGEGDWLEKAISRLVFGVQGMPGIASLSSRGGGRRGRRGGRGKGRACSRGEGLVL